MQTKVIQHEEEEELYDEVDQEEITELLEEQENTNQRENTQTEEPVEMDPDEVLQQQDEEIVFTDEETDEETKEEAQETEQRRSGREGHRPHDMNQHLKDNITVI